MVGKNNPFNIRYGSSKWLGQTAPVRGFCSFVDISYGIRAAFILIFRSYRKQGVLTIDEIISRFAPESENNTSAYVSFVCNYLDVFPWDIPSNKTEYVNLLVAMSKYEGNPLFPYQILSAIDKFNLKALNVCRKSK